MDQFVVFMIGLLGSNLVLSSFFFFLGKEAGRREIQNQKPTIEDASRSLAEAVRMSEELAKIIEKYGELNKQFEEDEE